MDTPHTTDQDTDLPLEDLINKHDAIRDSKSLRVGADAVLQEMKSFVARLKRYPDTVFVDKGEVIAQCMLSIRDMESAIMRQGMVLKNVGNPTPYPESYNPSSSKVEPTADGVFKH